MTDNLKMLCIVKELKKKKQQIKFKFDYNYEHFQ